MRNAIQAVLAGLSGGLEGRAMQRTREDELRRLDEERLYQRQRDSAASERQALQDAVALAEKGYVEQGERAETVKRATPALQSAMVNAVSSLSGGPMVAPVNPQALQAAAGQFGPAVSTVNVGGKTLERAQTPMQERTMLAAQERDADRFAGEQAQEKARRQQQGDVQEKATSLAAAFGTKLTREQADAIARGAAKISDFIQEELTPFQKASLSIQERQLGLSERQVGLAEQRAALDGQVKQQTLNEKQAKAQASADALQSMLPTVAAAARDLAKWGPNELKKLSSSGVNAAMVAATEATSPLGMLSATVLNKTMTNPLERRYAEYARQVADAVARASEVGVLTNQDIARYQSQVSGVAGQSDEDMARKLKNLQTWANWLASNKGKLATGDRAALPQMPGESAAEFAARTGRGPF